MRLKKRPTDPPPKKTQNNTKGHGDAVSGVAWSADGGQLATACGDLTLRVFDLSSSSGGGVAARDPKFKFIKTPHPPLAVGFGDSPGAVVAVLRANSPRR